MATAMMMRWDGLTVDQYEQALEKVGWDRNVPDGAKLHVSGFSDGGLNVLDVWESPEAFQAFLDHRLGPAVPGDRYSGRARRALLPNARLLRTSPGSRRDDARFVS
jgi:hypothetical protein